jgi:diguanylate cyclase (GGDEF)-like protein/PAS domain S-box-containing protein
MSSGKSLGPGDATQEVSALVDVLRETEQRIEDMTAGEADSVADRDGRMFLLRRARAHIEISERKRNQVAIAQSEAGLHRAQLMAKLAHVITGPDGSFEQWSETLPQLIGVELARLPRTTRAWLRVVHPDDRLLFCAKAIEASVTKLRMGLEYRVRKADGEWIHVRQCMEPLEDEGDVSVRPRWFNTLQDVTAERTTEESLRRSESIKGAILESSLDCIITVNHEGNIVEFNPAAEATFGLTHEQALGKVMVDLIVPPRLRDAHRRGFARYLATGEGPILGKRLELEAIRSDGTEFPIELTVTALGATSTPMFTAFIRDITTRKEADQKIKRLNRVYAVLSGINALIGRVRDRNELFRETTRIAVEEGGFRMAWIGVVDREAGLVKPIATAGDVRDFFETAPLEIVETKPRGHGLAGRAILDMKPVISNDVHSDPQRLMKRELAERGINSVAVIPLIVGDEAVGVLALYATEIGAFDQDEMRLLLELAGNIAFAIDHIVKQERLDYFAYYDALTGLANHNLFLERVAQYMRSAVSGGHKLALYLIDLERFKNINDSLGQSAGDALLRQVAEWLTDNVEDANLLARVGADHFAVVLPEVSHETDVARLLEKKLKVFLEHPFRLNDTVFRIAAKVGVALFPDDGANADALFKNAEAALKRAKASGDRYLFYTQKMTESMAGRLTLENQLRQALDNDEFVLHYQPKVSFASRKLTGAEALIRWNDPRTGLVPPGRFIPILEETGLIVEVGRWALRKAIEDYLSWRAAGLPAVRIAVNVSPMQLRRRGFIAEIEQAIGIDANAAAGLELEITESMIMEDVTHSIVSLQAIRAMGVSIAIDDFGTGFSSLGYLAKLPVDTLKIDRSFVTDMTAAPEGLALVSTIINLAHSLELNVVAEGVETEEQSRLLRLLKCDEMQGFLFGKPVPRDIFETRFLVPPADA